MAKPQQKQLGNIRELDVDGYGSVDLNGSSIVNAADGYFDNLFIDGTPVGSGGGGGGTITDWQSYTPILKGENGAIHSPISSEGFYRIVGDSLEIRIMMEPGSNFSGAIWGWGLPAGFTIDWNKIPTKLLFGGTTNDVAANDGASIAGSAFASVDRAERRIGQTVVFKSPSGSRVELNEMIGVIGNADTWFGQSKPDVWVADHTVCISCSIPVIV